MKRLIALLLGAALAGAGVAAPAYAASGPQATPGDRVMVWSKKVTKNAPPTTFSKSRTTSSSALLAGTPYFYAGGAQDTSSISPAVTTIGANFVGFGPYLDTAHDAHTLVESAVRKTPGSNVGVVEAGVTKDPLLYADSQPRLFVYAWDKNGAGVGYNTNFTLLSTRHITPGDVVTGNVTLIWYYQASSNRWWLQVNGSTGSGYIGYYENSVFGTSFTFDKAGQYLAFGEIAQLPGGTRTFTCSDMGNGQVPSATSTAYVGSVSYNGSGTNVNMTASPASTGFGTYHGTLRTFRYGGPGTDSLGNLPGNTGGC